MTLVVLVLTVVKMWLAGLVARLLDSVVKQLGSCIAMGLTYFAVILLGRVRPGADGFDFQVLVSLAVVALAILSFAVSTRTDRELEGLRSFKEKYPRRGMGSWVEAYRKASPPARTG